MIAFETFKKNVIKYFHKTFPLETMYAIKCSIGFREPDVPTIHQNFSAYFQYEGKAIELNLYDGNWLLSDITDEHTNGYALYLNEGHSIEECCDYLWYKDGVNLKNVS